ncbi:ATP-binding protein [Mycoplasma sp. ATU-Cv-508]|uniref:ATP-binding protein n=1 Tax=Mycoplasma sp. ATU-Cv-508 TaxID=2048001 RepID=UPI001374FF96
MENLKITSEKETAKREYVIEIGPEMLKLIGTQMYKNMYFILGELIANAWDADAENVYIKIEKNSVTIEDDGNGMSYKDGEIAEKYLKVGIETRKNQSDELTSKLRRKKMGRKGIGKLAALGLSDTYTLKTIKNGEKSGFTLSTKMLDETRKLEPINEEDVHFYL